MDQRFADYGIEIPAGAQPTADGDIKTFCPRCRGLRKPGHRSDRPLSVNVDKGVWHCFNCDWRGALGRPEAPPAREYNPPKLLVGNTLYSKARDWFAERGISEATLQRMHVTATGRRIAFPYYLDGEHINTKYRHYAEGAKGFEQDTGTRHTWYNVDAVRESSRLYVVESEKDALSLIECGIDWVISCPDGAGTLSDEWFDDVDWEAKERVVLAGDMDAKGRKFCEEVARRVGKEKCWQVRWPDGENDANDTLMHIGPGAVLDAIFEAQPFPVEGLVSLRSDHIYDAVVRLYDDGMPKGVGTKWTRFNQLLTLLAGQLTFVTGYPGSGKGEWTDELMLQLAELHGWKFGVFSPENFPIELHIAKLLMKVVGKPFGDGPTPRMTRTERDTGMEFLSEHVYPIVPEEPSLEAIIDAAKVLVRRNGVNALLLDPWNEMIHSAGKNELLTNATNREVRLLKEFGHTYDVHSIGVVHPRKPQPQNGALVPKPYDAADSAAFFNKADNFLAVGRDKTKDDGIVEVHVQKVRFRHLGTLGVCSFGWDKVTGRYTDLSVSTGGLEI